MKLLFCDDHLSYTESIKEFMSHYKEIDYIGEARNISQAMAIIKEHKIDVAFVDLGLGKESGIDLIKQISTQSPMTCAVVLTMYEANIYGIEALKAGAKGYITKEFSAKKFMEVIKYVMAGNYYFMPDMINLMADTLRTAKLSRAEDVLNENELKVMELMENGRNVKEISAIIHSSDANVYKIQDSILRKLGLADKRDIITHRYKPTKM